MGNGFMNQGRRGVAVFMPAGTYRITKWAAVAKMAGCQRLSADATAAQLPPPHPTLPPLQDD